MVWSSVYLAVRSVFALVVLLGRSDRSKELEILVLRHEVAVLRRQSRRTPFVLRDRALLAVLSRHSCLAAIRPAINCSRARNHHIRPPTSKVPTPTSGSKIDPAAKQAGSRPRPKFAHPTPWAPSPGDTKTRFGRRDGSIP